MTTGNDDVTMDMVLKRMGSGYQDYKNCHLHYQSFITEGMAYQQFPGFGVILNQISLLQSDRTVLVWDKLEKVRSARLWNPMRSDTEYTNVHLTHLLFGRLGDEDMTKYISQSEIHDINPQAANRDDANNPADDGAHDINPPPAPR